MTSQGTAFHRLLGWLLRRVGRATVPDPNLSAGMIFGEVTTRLGELARGTIRLRRLTFLGAGVRIRGKSNLSVGRFVGIGNGSQLDCRSRCGVSLGASSRLGRMGIVTTTSNLRLVGQGLTLGQRSGIGDFFHLGCSGGVTIGDDVIIGPFFTVHSQEHNFLDPHSPIRSQGTTESPVVIGDDTWIGARVTVLAGTRLGPRTIVAAGSVVRGEHPGNEILGGVPARRLRKLD